jgi:hypothetical protein
LPIYRHRVVKMFDDQYVVTAWQDRAYYQNILLVCESGGNVVRRELGTINVFAFASAFAFKATDELTLVNLTSLIPLNKMPASYNECIEKSVR